MRFLFIILTGLLLINFQADNDRKMELRSFEGDRLVCHIKSEKITNIEPKRYKLINMLATIYQQKTNEKLVVLAKEGDYNENTKIFHLTGDVKFTTEKNDEFRSEYGVFDFNKETFETNKDFVFKRPNVTLKGSNLVSDQSFKNFKMLTPCNVSIIDNKQGNMNLSADSSELELEDTKEGISNREIKSLLAQGNVDLKDSTGLSVKSETLTWDSLSNVAIFAGDKVEIIHEKNILHCKKANFNRSENQLLCDHIIDAKISNNPSTSATTGGSGQASDTIEIVSQKLMFNLVYNEKWGLKNIEAEGNCTIKQNNTVIYCDTFKHSLEESSTLIIRLPGASISNTNTMIKTPKSVTISDTTHLIGPKSVSIRSDKENYFITCDGQLSMNTQKITMNENCLINNSNMQVISDEVSIFLSEEKVQKIVCRGKVVLTLKSLGIIYAEEAVLLEQKKELVATGNPYARFISDEKIIVGNVLNYSQLTGAFSVTFIDQPSKMLILK